MKQKDKFYRKQESPKRDFNWAAKERPSLAAVSLRDNFEIVAFWLFLRLPVCVVDLVVFTPKSENLQCFVPPSVTPLSTIL